eukprot:3815853-Pyramimonas_sp.AAC.1
MNGGRVPAGALERTKLAELEAEAERLLSGAHPHWQSGLSRAPCGQCPKVMPHPLCRSTFHVYRECSGSPHVAWRRVETIRGAAGIGE